MTSIYVNLYIYISATCTQKRTCPQNGFQGKDCKCYCKGNPIKECDGTDDNTGTDEESQSTMIILIPVLKCALRGCIFSPCNLISFFFFCLLLATEEEEICFDYHPLCSAWAAVGHCTASRDFMTKYCQKSCGVCGDDEDTEESRRKLIQQKRQKFRLSILLLIA